MQAQISPDPFQLTTDNFRTITGGEGGLGHQTGNCSIHNFELSKQPFASKLLLVQRFKT